MKKKEIEQTVNASEFEEKNHTGNFILLFIVFFIIGTVLGVICTYKYLDSQDSDDGETAISGPLDITEDKDYQSTISKLYETVQGNTAFYATTGVDLATWDNSNKLTYVYKILNENNQYTTEAWNQSWLGSGVCYGDFISDIASNADGSVYSTYVCTVRRYTLDSFVNTYKDIFRNSSVDTNMEFYPEQGTKCIVDNGSYVCGTINRDITGSLESKFEIIKVIKEEDGTIKIYDKGYLQDTRSNIVNPNDGYDNYYLHSSDSADYYYELKSADNLTFIHTFKLDESNNYYYWNTVMENKK
ncbi:MAG: hypothetical protein IJ475_00780 [Bacilli bacterium]|nr:hypothetical protein [Bacilli bacterium]